MQQHCLHVAPKASPTEPTGERINITFRWIWNHRFHCPLRRLKPLPHAFPFYESFNGTSKGQRSKWFFKKPYVHCWIRDLPDCGFKDPNYLEWRVCDGCNDQPRNCCEGQGDWAGQWFCRKCWTKWRPLFMEASKQFALEELARSLALNGNPSFLSTLSLNCLHAPANPDSMLIHQPIVPNPHGHLADLASPPVMQTVIPVTLF